MADEYHVTNTTGSDVTIEDLGIVIGASDTEALHDLASIDDIISSDSLKSLVTAGTLTLNDGTDDLSTANALLHLKQTSEYEDAQSGGDWATKRFCIAMATYLGGH